MPAEEAISLCSTSAPPSEQETGKIGCITVCRTCAGSDALLSDLEDLCKHVAGLGAPALGGCLNACSQGPNCLVNGKLVTSNSRFENSLELLRQAQTLPELVFPVNVEQRARLKSDALRLMASSPSQDLSAAEDLLTQAIRLESGDPGVSSDVLMQDSPILVNRDSRLRELRMLRADARGSWQLKKLDDALQDLDDVIRTCPDFPQAYLEKAKILRRARRPTEALEQFRKALSVGTLKKPSLDHQSLPEHVCAWIRRAIEGLEQRIVGQVASPGADGGAISISDSGDGSGKWKVVRITGVSFDTCLYHLENHPPAVPHPYPNDAWHVSAQFGASLREYTPVSSAADWEQGRLVLLVKTYIDGVVSKKFATLQPWNVSKAACWLIVTVPKLTLRLPHLTDGGHEVQSISETPTDCRSLVHHVGLVIGGTGIAPALQILREVANPEGAFGAECKGTVLYSSRRSCDVLMLDELRTLEAAAPGKIVVWHTLTDFNEDSTEASAQAAASAFSKGLSSLPCRHFSFASPWKPFKPKAGPLRVYPGQEAGLRGRITPEMLSALLPEPRERAKIVVSGPPMMWEDTRDMLLSLGHSEDHLIELKSLSLEQQRDQQSMSATSKSEVTSRMSHNSDDLKARIDAARAISDDLEALKLKAAAGVESTTAASDEESVAKTTQKRAWSSGAGWYDSDYKKDWPAEAWKNVDWYSWSGKNAKWTR